jgi:hypothetical protein
MKRFVENDPLMRRLRERIEYHRARAAQRERRASS